jgi:hypothetical protein
MDNFNSFRNNEQVENSTSGLSPETRSNLFDEFSSIDFSQNSSSSLDFLPGLDLVDSESSTIGTNATVQDGVPQESERSGDGTTSTNPSSNDSPETPEPLERITPDVPETEFSDPEVIESFPEANQIEA